MTNKYLQFEINRKRNPNRTKINIDVKKHIFQNQNYF